MKLVAKRQRLMKQLSEVGPFIAGTLAVYYRTCGTQSCRCKKGGAKHKAMYFTWKDDKQKTKSVYVPVTMYDEAILWANNYKKMKTLIKKLSAIQQDILCLR